MPIRHRRQFPMAKRKEVCIKCGYGAQQIHSMCYNCHEEDFEGLSERVIARIGNDHFTRCDEADCWVCDTYKWEHKRTRPPKYSKKELLNRAKGRHGRSNKKSAAAALEQLRAREDKANLEKQRDRETGRPGLDVVAGDVPTV